MKTIKTLSKYPQYAAKGDVTVKKSWRRGDDRTPDDEFMDALKIRELDVGNSSVWTYVDTPKGKTGLHFKSSWKDENGNLHKEIHWLTAQSRGSGRAALQNIVEQADRFDITLQLYAVPLDAVDSNPGSKLSKEKLEAFYKSFGFKVIMREKDKNAYALMERKPK